MKTNSFENHPVVSCEKWLAARKELLREEKEFTRLGDRLAARRRELPWVKMPKLYTFESPRGPVTLAHLFEGRSQLMIQHFMLGPGWEEGCKSCSFMMDHFNPTVLHLKARDVAFAAISQAPLAEIQAFKARMGWAVNWVSSYGSGFNQDFQVSFTAEEIERGGVDYNYTKRDFPQTEAPGISVFARDAAGEVYHTYSTFGRGVEVVMTTYDLLDLVPKGRDEANDEYGMQWVRHHDRYEQSADVLETPEFFRSGRVGRAVRWLLPTALLALAPKCVVCVLAYAGLGAALGIGGPEICGAPPGSPGPWVSWLAVPGAALGTAGFLHVCRFRGFRR